MIEGVGSVAKPLLAQLKTLDVAVTLDDVGHGFASLAHLRDRPLDEVTIDTTEVVDDRADLIARAVVEQTLRLAYVRATDAEVIETDQVCDSMLSMGCRRAVRTSLRRLCRPP